MTYSGAINRDRVGESDVLYGEHESFAGLSCWRLPDTKRLLAVAVVYRGVHRCTAQVDQCVGVQEHRPSMTRHFVICSVYV